MKFICIFLISCVGQLALNAQLTDANEIVNKSILVHGGDNYDDAHFSYDFRQHHYVFKYDKGTFQYERHKINEGIIDQLTNDKFERLKDGKVVELSEKDKKKFSNSINSVHYFTFLPFFLNDAAVNKKLLGQTLINGEKYFEIEVTFNKDGGGTDFEDVYVYWIHQEKYTMDYLAYSFHVNGGGVRFRSAYNKRKVGGITFQDYINYKHDKNTPVSSLEELYVNDKLVELSKIELKNIRDL